MAMRGEQRGEVGDRPLKRSWPALDGIRGTGVVLMMLFHLDGTRVDMWNPLEPSGGFLSVDMFFVVSGFLITSLLVGEHSRTGRVGFGDFYARRALRLLPALGAALALALVAAAAIHGSRGAGPWLRQTLDGVPWVVFYTSNWHVAFFSGGRLRSITNGLLLPTWSLGLEEQFYLSFPILLVLTLRLQRRKRNGGGRASLGGPAVVLGSLSVAVMAWRVALGEDLLHAHGDVLDRVYYGSDTHCDGLLLGCAVALAVASPGIRRRLESPGGRRAGAAGALVGAAALALLFVRATQFATPDMELAIAAADVATALVVVGVMTGLPGPLRSLLENRVVVWIGKRSYGLYLYSFPITITAAVWMPGAPGPARYAVVLGSSFAAATVSYRYLERPFLARKSRFERNEAFVGPAPAAATPTGQLEPALG